MRNLFFSLIAVGVAAVAAMTATTAMLNAPVHPMPAVMAENVQPAETPAPPASQPATSPSAPPAKPGGTPDAGAKPGQGAPAGAADKADKKADEEGDKDPYEGIAPEEIPPDMQYSADSSVSFPTNI